MENVLLIYKLYKWIYNIKCKKSFMYYVHGCFVFQNGMMPRDKEDNPQYLGVIFTVFTLGYVYHAESPGRAVL